MKEEYLNVSQDCDCQRCNKLIPIGQSVFAVNDDWVNICEDCLSEIDEDLNITEIFKFGVNDLKITLMYEGVVYSGCLTELKEGVFEDE